MIVTAFMVMRRRLVRVSVRGGVVVMRRRHTRSLSRLDTLGTCIMAGCPVDYPHTPRWGGTERGSKT